MTSEGVRNLRHKGVGVDMLIEQLKEWYCMMDSDDEREAIAALFRLRCMNDSAWLWRMIEECPGDVVDVGILVGRIVVDGIQYPPASMGWSEWVGVVLEVNDIDWNAKPLNLNTFLLPSPQPVVKEPHRLTHSPERGQAILFSHLP